MSDLRVPCVPEYWPDKRHFRGKEVHSADPNGWFFAVFRGRGPGVYTTMYVLSFSSQTVSDLI
jgi:hypothetical protein